MNILVTTGHKSNSDLTALAKELSAQLKAPYLERGRQNLDELFALGYDLILSVTRKGLILTGSQGEHFFHPSMAKVRIKSLVNGNPDQMIDAMSLSSGDAVLDCTLGLGADAMVASYYTGPKGRVVGLEKVQVLALILKEGLKRYPEEEHLKEAMNRIEVVNSDYLEFLLTCADNSFDVVYFDPMFRMPQEKTSAFVPMRQVADSNPLNPEAVREALRVARKRVVLKERRQSKEFSRLGFGQILGGKYSPVAYGVIDVRGEAY